MWKPRFTATLPDAFYAEFRSGDFALGSLPDSHGVGAGFDFTGGDGTISIPDSWRDVSYIEIIDYWWARSVHASGPIFWRPANNLIRYNQLNVGGYPAQAAAASYSFSGRRPARFLSNSTPGNITFLAGSPPVFQTGAPGQLPSGAAEAPVSGEFWHVLQVWGVTK